MNDNILKYLIARILGNAQYAAAESRAAVDNSFFKGECFAYYEVLDILKNELIAGGFDLKEYGLDIDLEELVI